MTKVLPLLLLFTLTAGCAGMDNMASDDTMSSDKKMDTMKTMDNGAMKQDGSMMKSDMSTDTM